MDDNLEQGLKAIEAMKLMIKERQYEIEMLKNQIKDVYTEINRESDLDFGGNSSLEELYNEITTNQ